MCHNLVLASNSVSIVDEKRDASSHPIASHCSWVQFWLVYMESHIHLYLLAQPIQHQILKNVQPLIYWPSSCAPVQQRLLKIIPSKLHSYHLPCFLKSFHTYLGSHALTSAHIGMSNSIQIYIHAPPRLSSVGQGCRMLWDPNLKCLEICNYTYIYKKKIIEFE